MEDSQLGKDHSQAARASEMYRVLSPGKILLVSDFEGDVLAQWLERRNSNPNDPGFDPLAGQG